MKFIRICFLVAAFIMAWAGSAPDGFAATPTKTHYHFRFHGFQCATYVRLITPILLRGNAWTWWQKATGQYDKGNDPKMGAVIVFKRTKTMPLGHVAVVRRVVSDRE